MLSSATEKIRSRDTPFPYRQNSDLFYLTGISNPDQLFLVHSEYKSPILISPPKDPVKELWDGPQPPLSGHLRKLGIKQITSEDPLSTAKSYLHDTEHLIYGNEPDSLSAQLALELLSLPAHRRGSLPISLHHSDTLLVPLRLYKSPQEISLIKEAALITSESLFEATTLLRSGVTEGEVKAAIEYGFRARGAEVAFSTIAATGGSAAYLHYQAHQKKLRSGQLILLDCGAEYQMYAADISRTLPVGGKFSGVLSELYDAVLEAQLAAISRVKHGVKIKTIYDAASTVLLEFLKDHRLITGSITKALREGKHRPFFPHGIGHPLGIDVHDLGNMRGNNDAVVETGMVLTIEPGLYFQKRTKDIPPCGVRIEDDLQVTKNGCKILTPHFPKARADIEELMAG